MSNKEKIKGKMKEYQNEDKKEKKKEYEITREKYFVNSNHIENKCSLVKWTRLIIIHSMDLFISLRRKGFTKSQYWQKVDHPLPIHIHISKLILIIILLWQFYQQFYYYCFSSVNCYINHIYSFQIYSISFNIISVKTKYALVCMINIHISMKTDTVNILINKWILPTKLF